MEFQESCKYTSEKKCAEDDFILIFIVVLAIIIITMCVMNIF